jgi:hypothetical protein
MKALPVPKRAVIASSTTDSERRAGHWFYISVALLVIITSVAAFAPSILDQPGRTLPLTWLVAAHGVVTGGWVVLFLVQATLIATKRTSVHRRLGAAGLLLAAVMVVLGYQVTIGFGRRGLDLSGDVLRAISRSGSRRDPATMLFPLAELVNFAALVAVGVWYRHRPDVHKRLMLFALTVLVIEPVLHLVGHLSGHTPMLRGKGPRISGPLMLVLLCASAVNDRLSRGRVHPVSLVTPILMVAWQMVIVFVVFPSKLWHTCAAWLVR